MSRRENFPTIPKAGKRRPDQVLKCPPVPEGLLLFLENLNPTPLADPSRFPDSRTLYFDAGAAALVRKLRAAYELQQETVI